VIVKNCDSITYRYNYFYDENENNSEQNLYISDSLVSINKYAHNNNGNVNLFVQLNSQGDTLHKTYFKYDEKGNLTETTYFTGAPRKLFKIEKFRYDEISNKIQSEHYSKDSVLTSKYVFQYDSLNRIQHTIFYYFSDDYQTELLNEEKEYFYTGDDTMAYKIITRSFSDDVETNTYIYDPYGNWTEHRQEMHNGFAIYIIKRKIEYYEE
jgi:hypothetical protein